MASPAGQFHPWRLITTFLVIMIGLYALVFFTPGSRTPKLGIDLQGGTRITLKARTADGSTPSRDAMNQARDIMERRVNGSGVAGAQVQVDGADQLVITVPGQENNLEDLTRSAQLNIRPVVSSWTSPDVAAAISSGARDGATGTATAAPRARHRYRQPGGDRHGRQSCPAHRDRRSGSVGFHVGRDECRLDVDVPAGSATPCCRGGQRYLRRPDHPSSHHPGSHLCRDAAPRPPPAPRPPAAPARERDAASTGTATSASGPPPASAFPAGSDPKVPTQPAGEGCGRLGRVGDRGPGVLHLRRGSHLYPDPVLRRAGRPEPTPAGL